MAKSPEEQFLETAFQLEVISGEQYSDALRALELVQQAGVRKSAASILEDKGYATPDQLEWVKKELERAEGGGQPAKDLDFAALSGLDPKGEPNENAPIPPEDDLLGEPSSRSADFVHDLTPEDAGEPELVHEPVHDREYEPEAAFPADLDVESEEGGTTIRPKSRIRSARRRALMRRAAIVGCTLAAVAIVVYGIIWATARWYDATARRRIAAAENAYQANQPARALDIYRVAARGVGEPARLAQEAVERIEREVASAQSLFNEGRDLVAQERHREAVEKFGAILEKYPKSGRVVGHARGELVRAKRHLYAELTGQAQAAEGRLDWHEAARLYGEAARYEDEGAPPLEPGEALASEMARRAAAKAQAFDEAAENAAAAVRERRWQDARREALKAVAIIPHDPRAYSPLNTALQNIPPPEGMAIVPPGMYRLGTSGERGDNPERTAFVLGCYLDKAEVTNEQYARFVRETGHPHPPHWEGAGPPEGDGDLPVVNVSWDDARAYAAWAGKRLPSSDEWEAAARGFGGRPYPWGDEFSSDKAVFSYAPRPAGSAPSDMTPEGIQDLAGNVSEWAEDAYAGKGGPLRVVRGASWAGAEKERRTRVLFARGPEAPFGVCLVDDPANPALPVWYPADRCFTFSSVVMGEALFRYFLWVPEIGGWDRRTERFQPGTRVHFRMDRAIPVEGRTVRFEVDYDTGFVLRGIEGEGAGAEAVLSTVGRTELRLRPAAEPPFGPPPAGRPVQPPQVRRLAQVAQSANLFAAPPDGRFINVGFRCAKDFASVQPTP